MTEQWLAIGVSPNYEVSDLGRVRRAVAGRATRVGLVLKGGLSFNGYRHVTLGIGGRQKTRTVHSLVCEAFHGPRPTDGHDVAHFDGDKQNNVAANLRWATRKDNCADTVRLGRTKRGSANVLARLKEADVRQIRAMLGSGQMVQVVAAQFGVSRNTISHIKSGRYWGWLGAN